MGFSTCDLWNKASLRGSPNCFRDYFNFDSVNL